MSDFEQHPLQQEIDSRVLDKEAVDPEQERIQEIIEQRKHIAQTLQLEKLKKATARGTVFDIQKLRTNLDIPSESTSDSKSLPLYSEVLYKALAGEEELDELELSILYEIETIEEEIDTETTTQFDEVRTNRDQKHDLSQILGIKEEHISLSVDEAVVRDPDNTKWYHYGNLDIPPHIAEMASEQPVYYPVEVQGDFVDNNPNTRKEEWLPLYISGNYEVTKFSYGWGYLPREVGGNVVLPNLRGAEPGDTLYLPQYIGGDLHLERLDDVQGVIFPDSIGGDLHLTYLSGGMIGEDSLRDLLGSIQIGGKVILHGDFHSLQDEINGTSSLVHREVGEERKQGSLASSTEMTQDEELELREHYSAIRKALLEDIEKMTQPMGHGTTSAHVADILKNGLGSFIPENAYSGTKSIFNLQSSDGLLGAYLFSRANPIDLKVHNKEDLIDTYTSLNQDMDAKDLQSAFREYFDRRQSEGYPVVLIYDGNGEVEVEQVNPKALSELEFFDSVDSNTLQVILVPEKHMLSIQQNLQDLNLAARVLPIELLEVWD